MPGDAFSRQLGLLVLSPTASGGGCPSIVAAEVAVVRRVLASTLKETLSHIALRASWHGNRPGRNGTCNPRFWSPLLPTPALLHNAGVDTNPGTVRVSDWTEVTADRTNAAFPSSLTAPSRVPSVLGQGPRDRVVPRERHCARTWSEGRFPPAQLG